MDWNGNLADFNTTLKYKCADGLKFADSLEQTFVEVTCLPGNNWTVPEDWGTCVESKEVLVKRQGISTLFLIPAKYCPEPPGSDDVTLDLLNSGTYYNNSFHTIKTPISLKVLGCDGLHFRVQRVKGNSKFSFETKAGTANHTEMDFVILIKEAHQVDIKAILLFSQPLASSSIKLSTDVSSH